MQNKEQVLYADLLRIAATAGVIMLHTAASRWYGTPVQSLNWQVMNIYDSLVRWTVPVSVMVSGIFQLKPHIPVPIQPLSCKEEYWIIFKKSIFRLICALVFWGVVYNAYRCITRYLIRHESVFIHEILSIPLRILFGPAWYHLWFIYMIIGLYLLTPLIRIFIGHAQESHLKGALILFAVIGTGFPFINFIIAKIPAIPNYKLYLPLSEVSGYLGYYIGGYYFAHYNLKKRTRLIFYILSIVSVLFTILGTSLLSLMGEVREGFLYEYILPTTMFTSWGVFIFFKETFGSMSLPQKQIQTIRSLSLCTLGIYLLHDLILQIFLLLGLSAITFNPIVSIPLISLSVFVISLLVIQLMRKIPLVGKYVV